MDRVESLILDHFRGVKASLDVNFEQLRIDSLKSGGSPGFAVEHQRQLGEVGHGLRIRVRDEVERATPVPKRSFESTPVLSNIRAHRAWSPP